MNSSNGVRRYFEFDIFKIANAGIGSGDLNGDLKKYIGKKDGIENDIMEEDSETL